MSQVLARSQGRQVEIVGTVAPTKAHDNAEDTRELPRLSSVSWHPRGDFCPAR